MSEPKPDRPASPEQHDPSKPIAEQPDHSMKEEEQLGWDQAPPESHGPDDRHPRQLGQGGTLTPKQAREKFERDDINAERDND